MPAVLFGSIGALADTSELQRKAFNEAFRAHGLDWTWSQNEYRQLLAESGGEQRIVAYAEKTGDDVDAAAVHRTKSENFQESLRTQPITARPGVVETIEQAGRDGVQVALVTTTSGDNVAALAQALRPQIDVDSFALIVDSSSVEHPKPAPDAYRYALESLDEDAGDCVAVEDNVGGAQAAIAAGVLCVAFPGENNADHEFPESAHRVDELNFGDLQAVVSHR
ncbi:MAG: HAD-IA family hydrolase [Solirubrobacteraceae bacterium]